MFLQIDSTATKKIVDFVSKDFWHLPDFWINVGLALVGIFIGWLAYKEAQKAFNEATNATKEASKAFSEAGKAKDAATAAKEASIRAGKTVKKQSIMLSIFETIKMCQQIRQNMFYDDYYNRIIDINGKVRNMLGYYRDDLGQIHQGLFQLIETSNSEILTQFNLIEIEAKGQEIFKIIKLPITQLIGHLNELQGVIENELIINN